MPRTDPGWLDVQFKSSSEHIIPHLCLHIYRAGGGVENKNLIVIL